MEFYHEQDAYGHNLRDNVIFILQEYNETDVKTIASHFKHPKYAGKTQKRWLHQRIYTIIESLHSVDRVEKIPVKIYRNLTCNKIIWKKPN
jgi:hypothetical protein